jgi:hypothetical protein
MRYTPFATEATGTYMRDLGETTYSYLRLRASPDTPLHRAVDADARSTVTDLTVPSIAPAKEVIAEGRDASVNVEDTAADVAEIYPSSGKASSLEFGNAIRLLAEAARYADAALEADPEKDPVGADYHVGRIGALLPELFACRKVSESLGLVSAALVTTFANRAGAPLDRHQVVALRAVVRTTLKAPFMSSSKAVETLDRLEEAGLVIEPKGIAEFGELLDE